MSMKFLIAGSITVTALLSGCAGNPMRQYDGEMRGSVDLVKKGQVPDALALLEKNNQPGLASQDKDILYYLEKGQLLALDSNYPAAKEAWRKADEFIYEWEDGVRNDPAKIIGDIGSFLVNDKMRRYEGQDYEKVMLSTNLMLNHIAQGNHKDARIEMKKVVERETLIKNFREKEYDNLQENAKSGSVSVSMSDMKGYPMNELDSPDVTSLKNGFQNAFAHYLAGYFFEVTGEPSMAAPGYRNARILLPDSDLVKKSLRNVGKSKVRGSESDVLFVFESGFAPSWKSVTIPIPILRKNGLVATPLSFPVIKTENKGFVPSTVITDGKRIPVETLVNLDAMARRQLKDQMPSILLRTVIRAAAKSVAQEQANKANPLLGIASNVAAIVTEQADDRSWRTLPERISVARAVIPRGRQVIEFQTPLGSVRKEVEISGPFTVVPIRIVGDVVLVGKVNQPITIQESVVARNESSVPAQTVAKSRKKKKRAVSEES